MHQNLAANCVTAKSVLQYWSLELILALGEVEEELVLAERAGHSDGDDEQDDDRGETCRTCFDNFKLQRFMENNFFLPIKVV